MRYQRAWLSRENRQREREQKKKKRTRERQTCRLKMLTTTWHLHPRRATFHPPRQSSAPRRRKHRSYSMAIVTDLTETHAFKSSKSIKKTPGLGIVVVVVGRPGLQAFGGRRQSSPPQLLQQQQPRPLPAAAPWHSRARPRGGGEPGCRRGRDGGAFFFLIPISTSELSELSENALASFFDLHLYFCSLDFFFHVSSSA